MKLPAFATLLLPLCIFGAAATDQPRPWLMIVQWDNDLLTGTDDGYTNGARIAFSRELSPSGHRFNRLEGFLKSLTGAERDNALDDIRFRGTSIKNIQYGFGLSQLMFTPNDPDVSTPPDGERPYAGWLGLEFSLQAGSENSANTATLSIGTTGKNSYADDIQKWIHENISDSPVFQGWDTQAPAELTINLHLDHKTRLGFLEEWEVLPEIDGFYEWGASLGNLRTDAYFGALIRAGHNLPLSHATPRVQLGSFTDTIFGEPAEPDQTLSIYGFAGIRGYAVLHDISLDGPLLRDWDESVGSEPFVGEINFGVAARWRWLELSLAHNLRSDEFEGQRNRSRYGSVLLRIGTEF